LYKAGQTDTNRRKVFLSYLGRLANKEVEVSSAKKGFGVLANLLLVLAVVSAMILPMSLLAQPGYPLNPSDTEVANALDYLAGEQTAGGDIGGFGASAWVTMAIAAAAEDAHDWGVAGNSIVDYLAANAGSASSATDYARMALAIVAADEDATGFGGRDFVNLLKGQYNSGQIGDTSLLNDDFWGVMALISAGESQSSEVVADSVAFIKGNQNGDGGWSWGVGGDSDVDDTAVAIMALIAAGESHSSAGITEGLAYIRSQQTDNGGFLSWGATNADTDSWAICAIVAAGQDPTSADWTENGNTPVDDLLTFQQGDGSFYWQDGTPGMSVPKTTASAIQALLGEPYPVRVLELEEGVSVRVRVEGQSSTVWRGDVTVSESDIIADNSGTTYHLSDPTALGALDEASDHEARFPYYATDEYGGLYVRSINEEEPSGMNGWMYRVDYRSPSVGADQFVLDETTPPNPPHEEVLFYYGAWTDLPLKISVDETEVDVGENFSAMVSEYSDDTQDWSPCEGATVHADQSYTTGDDGTVVISVGHDATLHIFAEKGGHIRSDRVTVTVGEGSTQPLSSGEVNLTAHIIPAISIVVSPSNIDFGDGLGPGDTSAGHEVDIYNVGAWEIMVTAEVADEADNLYVNGIRLDGILWSLFQAVITRDDSTATQVSLHVPEDYAGAGEKTGTLTFWAEAAP
jgi:hypothetical protein